MYSLLQTKISSNIDLGFRILTKNDNFPPTNLIKDIKQNIDPYGKGKKIIHYFIINLHTHFFQRSYRVFLPQGKLDIFIVYV